MSQNKGNAASVPARRPQEVVQPQPLSEDTMRRFLAVQEQRLAIELKQSEIALKELEHNQKIADKSIEAQAEDRKDDRRTGLKRLNTVLTFGGGALLALLIFAGYALWIGKEAIILDVFKIAMGFVGGWGAAALWGKRRSQDDED